MVWMTRVNDAEKSAAFPSHLENGGEIGAMRAEWKDSCCWGGMFKGFLIIQTTDSCQELNKALN